MCNIKPKLGHDFFKHAMFSCTMYTYIICMFCLCITYMYIVYMTSFIQDFDGLHNIYEKSTSSRVLTLYIWCLLISIHLLLKVMMIMYLFLF